MTVLIQDLQALLVGLAPAGGVFYGVNTTEPPVTPYIVWTRVSSSANVTLTGSTDVQNTRVQIDIFGRTVADVVALESALEAAMAASAIVNVPLESRDVYEDVPRLYRVSKDFSVWSTN